MRREKAAREAKAALDKAVAAIMAPMEILILLLESSPFRNAAIPSLFPAFILTLVHAFASSSSLAFRSYHFFSSLHLSCHSPPKRFKMSFSGANSNGFISGSFSSSAID